MLKGRKILSLPVVTLEDRKEIGEVKDIIYDPFENRILGYLVDNGGWLREGKGFLHKDLIRREEDCLVIKDESVIQRISEISELKRAMIENTDIRGRKVECTDGKYVGIIEDLLLDETGNIAGYEISDGFFQDLLTGRSTISNQGLSVYSDKVVTTTDFKKTT